MTLGNGDSGSLTPPYGTPARELLQRHDSDITGLKSAMQTVANDVQELRGDVAEVRGITLRIEAAGVRRPSLPPMRPELDSKVDPVEFARKVAVAAVDGYRRADSTPEAETEKVVEGFLEKQRAATIVKAAEKRAAFIEKAFLALLAVVAAAVLGHYGWR